MKTRILFCIALFLAASAFQLIAQDDPVFPTVVSHGTFWGETPPLSSLPVLSDSDWEVLNEKFKKKELNKKTGERPYPFQATSLPMGPDEAWQKEMGDKGTLGTIMNFAGQGSNAYPTDPNGDVNQTHYFQTINSIYSIYTKAGVLVAGPTNLNLLFGSVPGTNCNDGDPIVIWDEAAGRWLVAEFSICNTNDRMLVAVSTTSNPTGTWYQYSFDVADVPDYEKFGVWRDAYYMGTNTSGSSDIYAFQRDVMLAGGASPTMIAFDNPWRPASGFHCVPPVDNDGTLAPSGTPGYFITINNDAWGGSDELWIYQFVVNWINPAGSTFTRTQQLAVTPFDNNFGAGWDNIAQQGTTQKLDAVLEVLMQRPQYRNFGTYQTIVCCHTVDVNNTDRAGIRWYELRRTTGNWSIRQTGTYSPDAHSRWMGSIALNGQNQIGLGYSISSSTLYPGIRYCGQSASAYAAGAGVMDIAEATIYTGTASQTAANRWGDYTMIAVDPSDNQTFWYTNQYFVTTSPVHPTRIASFSFDPYCTASGGCDEYISRVQIGTIDNVSTCSNYANYTSISDDFPLNAVKYLTVTNGSPYSADQCGVWVDWNKDNDFYDANEAITVTGTPGNGPYTATITPPAGTTTGSVRMRIRITYTGAVDPCGNTTYGEVEDYTLNITPASTSNTWLGITSTNWHTGSNWSLGVPPSSTTSATIPAGTPFSPVIQSGDAFCNNLVVSSGATLVQNSTSYFYVYGHFDPAFGQFTMNGTTSYLYFSGTTNNYWYNDLGNDIYTQVRVAKTSPTAQTYMYSDMTCSGNFRIDGGILEMAPNRTLTINNTSVSAFQVMAGGTLNLATGKTLTVAGGILFQDGSQANITGGNINCGSNFRVNSNTSYNIALAGATLNLNGSAGQYIEDLDGGNLQLHHLTINKSAGTVYIANANLDVNGNLLITSGTLSCNNAPTPTATYNIKIAGNWTNSAFPTGFVPGSGRVIFNGPGHQYVYSSENFNILEANMVAALRVNNAAYTVTCNQYDWTTGAIDVIAGTFTALDLFDEGLYGGFYVNPSGTLNITNSTSTQWVDLNGEIHIFGGTMNVSGIVSDWAYAGNAVIEMSGGILDFKTCGIGIHNTGYTLTSNITGGVIRTAYGFGGSRADFTPAAGAFEFYGSSDVYISQANGSTLYNVKINKSSKGGSDNIPGELSVDGRDGLMLGGGGKANSISLFSDFTITNNLEVSAGIFSLGGYICSVAHNANIYGTLAMTNAAGVLNIGTYQYDNLRFYPGSTGNLSAGNIYLKSWIVVDAGSLFTASTSNTIHIIGSNLGGGLACSEATAQFGNININKTANPCYLASDHTGPYNIQGSFTVQPGNSFQTGNFSMHVNGNVTDAATSSIYLYYASKDDNSKSSPATLLSEESLTGNNLKSGTKGGSLTIDTPFNLTGLLDVADGNVIVHGLFNVAATGTLTITSGSLLCDAPVTTLTYVAGNFNLGSGLYEVRFNGLNMYPATATIGAGVIKVGGSFIANSADKFKPGFGTVELINGLTGNYIQMHSTNYFNHLIVNRTNPIGIYSGTSLTVKKDLSINAGGLNSNNLPIYLGGHWNENMGPAGFGEGTGTVYFNGTGILNNQFITGNETFYNIENAKSGGGHVKFVGNIAVTNNFLANGTNIVDGPTLDINNLLLSTGVLGTTTGAPNITVNNFTMGGDLSVVDGNFTCMDVTNNGIFGNITLTNGSITLFQDAIQFSDLNANVTINGGYMAVNGGSGPSVWGWAAPCSLTMSGGVLDFNNIGIYISTSYPVTQNITGGTIKTNQSYFCNKATFTPAGGTVEMYAGSDAYVVASNGSHLFNLLINKSAGVKESPGKKGADATELFEPNPSVSSFDGLLSVEPGKRPVFPEITSKANEIYNGGVLKVMGTTTVNAGTFRLIGYPVTSMGNININTGGKLQLTEGSSLAIENGKTLTVNNGGILDVTGIPAFPALITRNSGFFGLNVESGGTIGAVYGIFEYTNTNGVNIKSGAVVDVVKPFNNCTFRNGQAAGSLMKIENNQTFYVENAVFPTNAGAGSFNVTKAINAGMVYFVTATGVFAGESFDSDPNNRIMWTNRMISMKAYLEGPFSGSGMSTTLNPILPLNHPFSPALPYFGNPVPDWYYTGAGGVAAIPNNNIVDWVLVDVRDAVSSASATPATSVARIPAFILNNGNIVGLNGSSNIELPVVITNNLFVALYHRNHIGILNANGMPYSSGIYSYDYTTGSSQVYGGTNAHKQLSTGVWGMMSGDGDGTGTVQTADKTNVWSVQAGTTGYKAGDYNMNRQVNNPDKDDKWLPNLGKGSFIPE